MNRWELVFIISVSYTHLDVYKRQAMNGAGFTNKPNYTPPDEPNEESVSLADLHTHSDSLIPDILISENRCV